MFRDCSISGRHLEARIRGTCNAACCCRCSQRAPQDAHTRTARVACCGVTCCVCSCRASCMRRKCSLRRTRQASRMRHQIVTCSCGGCSSWSSSRSSSRRTLQCPGPSAGWRRSGRRQMQRRYGLSYSHTDICSALMVLLACCMQGLIFCKV
jgi:hypothetical protein